MKNGFINKVILKGCYSGSQPYTKQSGWDAETLRAATPFGMTKWVSLWTNGFTLIELLVVVLIIGILAAVVLPNYQVAVRKTKYMQGVQLARPFFEAQERYKMANGSYTYLLGNLDIACPAGFSRYQVDAGAEVSTCSSPNRDYALMLSSSYLKYTDNTGKIIFDWSWNRDMYCIAGDTLGHKLCQQLGGIPTERTAYYYLKM